MDQVLRANEVIEDYRSRILTFFLFKIFVSVIKIVEKFLKDFGIWWFRYR